MCIWDGRTGVVVKLCLSLLCASMVSTGCLWFWILVIHTVRGVKTVQHNWNTLNLLRLFAIKRVEQIAERFCGAYKLHFHKH